MDAMILTDVKVPISPKYYKEKQSKAINDLLKYAE